MGLYSSPAIELGLGLTLTLPLNTLSRFVSRVGIMIKMALGTVIGLCLADVTTAVSERGYE